MTRLVIPCGLLLALSGAGRSLAADVIQLKSGERIYGEQVTNDGKHVRYERGDSTYSIPSALVDHIDHQAVENQGNDVSGEPPVSAPELPGFGQEGPVAGEQQLLGRVVHDGRVDREALRAMESVETPLETAVAFYIAGKQEYQSGDYGQAKRDFERALYYDRENPAALSFYAALLVKIGNAREAVSHARHAVRLAPDSADALAVLGYAQFAADRPQDAVESWRKSLALRPDTSIEKLLDRARREAAAESNYVERASGHFILRYEGAESSEGLRAQILSTLEAAYRELASAFGSEPDRSIQVVVYTAETFFDVTRAPAWIGALNDGKIRIPFGGLNSVTPELARILKHELGHSFVNQLSLGRCPQWLNEGIAQALEPRSLGARGRSLAELYRQAEEIPLNGLESGFSSLSGPEAALAYDESLATVEYIRDHYGMSDLRRILEKLGRGESVESALGSTIHSNYRELEGETGAFLLHRFGS